MAGSAKPINDAMDALIRAVDEFYEPLLMSSDGLMPIEQDPVEAIDCQKLTLAINTLQQLAIDHCPGV